MHRCESYVVDTDIKLQGDVKIGKECCNFWKFISVDYKFSRTEGSQIQTSWGDMLLERYLASNMSSI